MTNVLVTGTIVIDSFLYKAADENWVDGGYHSVRPHLFRHKLFFRFFRHLEWY